MRNEPFPSTTTKFLLIVSCVYAGLLVASNAAGAKLIELPFGLSASATVFAYAFTFTITDAISELYGRKYAALVVRTGLGVVFLSVLLFFFAIQAPAASFWENQAAYETVLGLAPRIFLGGVLAFVVSQHLDLWLFHFFKRITKGKHLWFRNNASTAISQLVDTAIFIAVSFYGVFPIVEAMIGQYIIKLIIAAADTPLVYVLVHFGRKQIEESE